MCLAVSRDDLPQRIGLDWSYDGVIGLEKVLRERGIKINP
jgi:hypothetical protein